MSIDGFLYIRRRMPHFFVDVNVLEYGPHSRSKTIVDLFSDSNYYVIDPASSTLEEMQDDLFNVTMSVNNFNFTNDYLEQFRRLHRVSSKFVMFSCLAAGHPDVGQLRNLTEADFHCKLDLEGMFDSHRLFPDYEDHILYFWGVKK